MIVDRFVTLKIGIEMPDSDDSGEVEHLVDEAMENAVFDFSYDSGDGTSVVDVTLHSYSDEEPE